MRWCGRFFYETANNLRKFRRWFPPLTNHFCTTSMTFRSAAARHAVITLTSRCEVEPLHQCKMTMQHVRCLETRGVTMTSTCGVSSCSRSSSRRPAMRCNQVDRRTRAARAGVTHDKLHNLLLVWIMTVMMSTRPNKYAFCFILHWVGVARSDVLAGSVKLNCWRKQGNKYGEKSNDD